MHRIDNYALRLIGPTLHRAVSDSLRMIVSALIALSIAAQTAAADEATGYRFAYQSPPIGTQVWQHVTMFANLSTTYEQSGQMISRSHRTVTREQIRRLVILEDREIGSSRVRVHYEKARETMSERGREPHVEDQPVFNQTYLVSRIAGDLRVTREDGSAPSPEELAIVRRNMQAVGRVNPLAKALHGRTVRIGEQIELPPELAADLLGWNPEYGGVQSVNLRLKQVTAEQGADLAVFAAEMVGIPGSSTSEGTRMAGDLTVELATCRTRSADMQAELATREERGPAGNTFFVNNRGSARMNTQARFLVR